MQKLFAMAALIASLASALVHAGYFCVTHKMPVYAWGESINFHIGRSHWGATGTGMALAGLASSLLMASCLAKPHVVLSWLNLTTVLLLVPAAYTGCCIALIFL